MRVKKSKPRKEVTFKIVRRYEPVEFCELMTKLSPVFKVWRSKKIAASNEALYNARARNREIT